MAPKRARHGRFPAESGRYERGLIRSWGWRKVLRFIAYGVASWLVLIALILGGLEMLQTAAGWISSILESLRA